MRFSEYVTYDAVDLARLVSKGEVTSSELSATACAAIEAYNGQITLSSRPSLRPSPRGEGAFRGVPFLGAFGAKRGIDRPTCRRTTSHRP
jgi:amidase